MSENHDYLKTGDPTYRLRADILMLMLKGAAYAAIFCLVVWFIVAAFAWIGSLLPEESRETEDPSPWSFLIDPATTPDRHII